MCPTSSGPLGPWTQSRRPQKALGQARQGTYTVIVPISWITALFLGAAAYGGLLDARDEVQVPVPVAQPLEQRGGNTYGIIINGDDSSIYPPIHIGNAYLAAFVMKRRYGIALDRMIILTERYNDREPKKYEPRVENLRKLFAWLKNNLGPEDSLVIYTTGHGSQDVLGTRLELKDGSISPEELAKGLLDNQAGSYLYIGDQCYSGKFAEAMTSNKNKKVIAISAVDGYHKVRCQFFIRPFFKALLARREDGPISEKEAFKIAAERSRQLHLESDKKEKAKGPAALQWLKERLPGEPLPVAQYLVSGASK